MMKRVLEPKPLPVYWIVVGIATVLLSPILSIFAAVQISANQAEHARQEQERAAAASAVESRRVVCGWLSAYLDTFEETPPTSRAGRNLQAKFLDLYKLSQCQPIRR